MVLQGRLCGRVERCQVILEKTLFIITMFRAFFYCYGMRHTKPALQFYIDGAVSHLDVGSSHPGAGAGPESLTAVANESGT